jgi:hypothetical protein
VENRLLASVHDRTCGEVVLIIPFNFEVASKKVDVLLMKTHAVLTKKRTVLNAPALNALIYSSIVRVDKQCATGMCEV